MHINSAGLDFGHDENCVHHKLIRISIMMAVKMAATTAMITEYVLVIFYFLTYAELDLDFIASNSV